MTWRRKEKSVAPHIVRANKRKKRIRAGPKSHFAPLLPQNAAERVFGENFKWLSCFPRILMNGLLWQKVNRALPSFLPSPHEKRMEKVFHHIQHQQKTLTIKLWMLSFHFCGYGVGFYVDFMGKDLDSFMVMQLMASCSIPRRSPSVIYRRSANKHWTYFRAVSWQNAPFNYRC